MKTATQIKGTKAMKTKHTTVDYTRSHLTAPRGRGSWAFEVIIETSLHFSEVINKCWFAPPNLTLTEARKAAVAHAAKRMAAEYPEVTVVGIYTDALA